MKKTLLTSLSSLALLAIASNARAGVSYGAFMYNALDSAGNPISNGTYRMVIDVNPAAGQPTLIASGVDISTTWTWDPSDILLDSGLIGGTENNPGECFPYYTGNYPAGAVSTEKIYLLWFESGASASPTAGSHYSYELLGTVDTDPGDYSFFPNGGKTSAVIPASVPEPASLTALVIGALGLIRRRRNA